MTETPTLTVIVPAFQCAAVLQACLQGLATSDLVREEWELLVVDDGSTDDTPNVARRGADVVLTVVSGPRGPAYARNLGAQAARGSILVFVDADVVLATSTLRGFAAHFATHPTIIAVFGAYDDAPRDPGFVSQYRNLLHRYVHTMHPGDTDTFWAGCGAVRRDAFFAVGGFDAERYRRPQIEDIDLGYRLRARGARIVLDPLLVGTHLKRWTLAHMLRTDLRERAIPWIHLLLRRTDVLTAGPLHLGRMDQALTVLAGVALVCLIVAVVLQEAAWGWIAIGCAGLIIVGNSSLIAWLARVRGCRFALTAIPLRVLFHLGSAVGAVWAIITHGREPGVSPALHDASPRRLAIGVQATPNIAVHRVDPLDGHPLERRLRREFAPVDSRAVGLSVGLVAALGLSALTGLSVAFDAERQIPLELLDQFFTGYSLSTGGALIGAGWALVTGFMCGWLLATARNVVFAVWLLKARIRHEITASQHFLDHL